jgi:organic hydroperoxide reductase OsmC/OhrA
MAEHHYTVEVVWVGNRGDGTSSYTSYGREHVVRAAGPPDLAGSADPGYRGDRSRWNPEQLFVASLSQCHMLWYLHLCADAGITVTSYVDEPLGTLHTDPDGSGRFTDVLLRPEVGIASGSDRAVAEHLHERAHAMCFLARSVSCPVRHAPKVSGP